MALNTQKTLKQALASLPAVLPAQRVNTPMLLQLAEHMAIQHALDRFERGETRVNAVQEMFAKMGKELEGLRKVLGGHEDRMRRAGMRVETYAEILDRQFWASLPENGKRIVLLSPDCWCIPPRNVRSFIDQALERGDAALAGDVLRNYATGLCNPEGEARSKTAAGMLDLVDLYGRAEPDVLIEAVGQTGTALEQALRSSDLELARELGETFTRLAQEATTQKNFGAVRDALEMLSTIETGGGDHREFAKSLRSRMGLEKQLSEFVDNAIRAPRLPDGLLEVVRRQPHQTAEQLAGRVIRCGRKRERERLVEIAKDIGDEAGGFLRQTLESRPAADAVAAIGLLCRLDPVALEEILPRRLAEWNRFYHDMTVRQLACCGAPERARLLLKFSEFLDPLVLPGALDEVAMCGDLSVVPTLLQLAAGDVPRFASPYLRVKAIEALGRLRPPEAAPFLRKLLEARQAWRWTHPREMRIVAAQAMQKIDPGWLQPYLAGADLPAAELALQPFDPMDDAPGVRQRTYQRIKLPKEIQATVITARDEYAIGIQRIDQDRADLPRVAETEVLPGAAGVDRFVDPVADRQVGTLQPLAAADVEDVRVRRRHGNPADRLRRLFVEDRRPRLPVIGGLPDAAIVDADIEDVRLLNDAGGADCAAAAEGPDRPPLQPAVHCRINRVRGVRLYADHNGRGDESRRNDREG